jgi:uncharacterized OB-fold protein
MLLPLRAGLFTLNDPPRLLAGRCSRCRALQFPRASTCSQCSGDAIDDVVLDGRGTLWGWTAVTAPPPGYRGDVPFGFGVVELPEGLRVITRLSHPVDELAFGMAMAMRIVPLHDDGDGETVVTYEFTPS